ncbi:hypothetical protein GCM10010300_32940 [Streptomyces olivaceoviridis]|uniref:hypothetical protein n=1 Tax=Streptomyces olivaceoviridis TaxID=1921 RepID=UPI0016741CBC|nr:hypothetical protein [Streptomyces olivaceoviridis]GGY86148.1 hypothetical protein GCM10010300_32940 [Streptomyces olivaceoviridis]
MRRTARALSAALAASAVLALTGPAAAAPVSGTLTAPAFCDPVSGPAPVVPAAASGATRATAGGDSGSARRATDPAAARIADAPCPSVSLAPGTPPTGGHPVTRSGEALTAPDTACADGTPCGQDSPQNAGREGTGAVPGLDGLADLGTGTGPDEGWDGFGQDGFGQDGAGRAGAGEVGPGQATGPDGGGRDGGGTGAGRDGAGQDGGGRQNTGKDSAGRDGTGKDSAGTGKDSAGAGKDPAGQDGSGRECAGAGAGAGAGSCGHDDHWCAESREGGCSDGRTCDESHGSDPCAPAGVQHGVDAGRGGTFDDSVPALAVGAALIAAACAGAGYRLFGHRVVGHRRFRGGEPAGM